MPKKLFSISTLNLNGIRSAVKKGLPNWVATTQPDCICVQELKAQLPDLEKEGLTSLAQMSGYFHVAEKKGYSGVGIYTRHLPSDVIVGWSNTEFDLEGRYIELRFDTPTRRFSIISAYLPSGTSGEIRQQAKFRFLDDFCTYLNHLRAEREFILCADVNIAHQNIDLKNWRANQKNSGFLPEERAWLTQLLDPAFKQGRPLVDVYRQLQPTATDACYTWWSNRGNAYANNVGWRLDYQIATADTAALARSEIIYKEQKFSDHAPLTVEYDFVI